MRVPRKEQSLQIVRCQNSGVFYAVVESRKGTEAVLRNARRLWFWSGAASLSQLAMDGTKTPQKCKFPIAVDRTVVTDVIEILDTTPKARASIEATQVWSA